MGNRKVYSSNSAGKEMQLPLSANCGPVYSWGRKVGDEGTGNGKGGSGAGSLKGVVV